MRTVILFFAIITSTLLYSQKINLENGKFQTFIINGDKSESPLEFTISPDAIEKIKQLDDYKKVEGDKEFIKKNIEKRNLSDPLLIFLMSKVASAGFATKDKFKYTSSFRVKEGSQGKIFISEFDGLTITFPFDVKNDLGNIIAAVSLTNSKRTTIQY